MFTHGRTTLYRLAAAFKPSLSARETFLLSLLLSITLVTQGMAAPAVASPEAEPQIGAPVHIHPTILVSSPPDTLGALTRVLEPYARDPELVPQIADALLISAEKAGVDPELVAAVMLIENDILNPRARSSVGAMGLMQVMGFWAGTLKCGTEDLYEIEGNICHGTKILSWYLRDSDHDVRRALLRYNGCVRGTNTPTCHRYPDLVLARRAKLGKALRLELASI